MTWVAAAVPGSEVRQVVQDASTGDFRMVLIPFDLSVLTGIEVTGGSLGFEETALPTNGADGADPTFEVPAAGCAYIGRLTFTYLLLPPGDGLTQLSMASDLADGGSLSILFTSAGTFVYLPDDPSANRIDVPEASRRPSEGRACPVVRARFRTLSP
jgi:hypothetical protein